MYQVAQSSHATGIDFQYNENSCCCSQDQSYCRDCSKLVCQQCIHQHQTHTFVKTRDQFEKSANSLREAIFVKLAEHQHSIHLVTTNHVALVRFCDYSYRTLENLEDTLEDALRGIKFYKKHACEAVKKTVVDRSQKAELERQIMERKLEDCRRYANDIPKLSLTDGSCKILNHYAQFLEYCDKLRLDLNHCELSLQNSVEECASLQQDHVDDRIQSIERGIFEVKTLLRSKTKEKLKLHANILEALFKQQSQR